MKLFEKKILKKLILKNINKDLKTNDYPLIDNPFEVDDVMTGIKVLLKGKITNKAFKNEI